ncbi:MAG: cysteine desulfurase CsdA [Saprospirales bacterium]|nr:cysteine desulfurase CsdA [Saprospirales bacterium]
MSGNLATTGVFDVEAVRKDFPILQREMNGQPLCFLDTAASSQKPLPVLQAMDNYYRQHHANVHRGVYQLSQEATDMFEAARKAVQRFIGAREEHEVIFTRGTTESINLVASSFGSAFLKPGDEVLITWMEHHSNIVPWQLICERTGATLRVVPISDEGELDMDALGQYLQGPVKILALTHVSNTLGTINPIREIVKMAHQYGIPVLVDGAQAVPHSPVNVSELDVDFYAFSGHKMYGPTGIGILFGKTAWLEKMPPYHGGGEMISRVTFEKTTYNELPFKFEAGTPDIAGSVGLHAAIEYLQGIGLNNIAEHENELLKYGTELLREIPGLRLIGNASNKAGLLSFVVEGTHPYDIGTLLDKMGIAVRTGHHCTEPIMDRFGIPGTVRASFGMYTTKAELDRLAAGIKRAVKLLL